MFPWFTNEHEFDWNNLHPCFTSQSVYKIQQICLCYHCQRLVVLFSLIRTISHLLHICSLFCDVRYLYFFQLIFWMMVNNCNGPWTCLKRKAVVSIACNQLKWLCINLYCTHVCCHKRLVFIKRSVRFYYILNQFLQIVEEVFSIGNCGIEIFQTINLM